MWWVRTYEKTITDKYYQVDPETRPSNIGPPFTGHFRVIADTPRGLQPFQPGMNGKATQGKPHPITERLLNSGPSADLNLDLRRNIYEPNGKDVTPATNGAIENGEASTAATENALKEPRTKFYCNTCSTDCTRARHHHAKITNGNAVVNAQGKIVGGPKLDICPACFNESRFPSSTAREEYVYLEDEDYSAVPDKDKPWTDAETLRLLEALEMHDEDWTEIANYVGTRTREQCVLKFLQLEIEDKYIDGEQTTSGSNTNLAWLSGGQIPFGRADNPVMSVIAFLASTVDPSVAAAAAGRSVDEIRKTMRAQLENTTDSTTQPTTSTTDNNTLKTEDTMDVDSTNTTQTNPQTTPFSLLAARSTALASHTERQITAQLSAVTALQTQKLELKLAQFAEMEKLLAAERRDLERRRRELLLERLSWRRRVEGVKEGVRNAVGLGLGRGDEEALRVLGEALRGLGIDAGVELVPSGGGAAGGGDAVMGGNGGNGDGGFAAMGGHGQADVQPLSAEMGQDGGFRTFEI